jgi:hypothetical protein
MLSWGRHRGNARLRPPVPLTAAKPAGAGRRAVGIVPFGLKPGSRVLISGCGGGFDFFCGTPVGLALEKQGHGVVYSSYSFSNLGSIRNPDTLGAAFIVDEKSEQEDSSGYFPEKFFCQWYAGTRARRARVYRYGGVSVAQLVVIFNEIYTQERIDYHSIVDGGCDGISGATSTILAPLRRMPSRSLPPVSPPPCRAATTCSAHLVQRVSARKSATPRCSTASRTWWRQASRCRYHRYMVQW